MKGLFSAALALALWGATAWVSPGALAAETSVLETPPGQKPRVVVTTDPELDDLNSLIRYLLYSSDFRTEGLIYASSQFHWRGDGRGTLVTPDGRDYRRLQDKRCPCASWRWAPGERFIDDAVAAYGAAYPNLRRHRSGYPTPASLRSKIRWGNVAFDGEMSTDTPGSDLIKTLLLDREESPVYLHAWGGQSTIARALKSIEEQYRGTRQWPSIRAKIVRKAVIHASGDQDDTYAKYIEPHWPEIRYRRIKGGADFSYFAPLAVSVRDAEFFSADWTGRNISGRGELGALYRVWGDGKQMVPGDRFDYFGIAGKSGRELDAAGYVVWAPVQPAGSFIAEGDTPTFLNLVDNGLEGFREASFGGWGGYRDPAPGDDRMRDPNASFSRRGRAPDHPFLATIQRDLAARLAWATTASFSAANHNPRVKLHTPKTIGATAGQSIVVRASADDPDGDTVRLRWWHWVDAGTYARRVAVLDDGKGRAHFTMPEDALPGQTIHLVAEAADDGSPRLHHYAHVVITVAKSHK